MIGTGGTEDAPDGTDVIGFLFPRHGILANRP